MGIYMVLVGSPVDIYDACDMPVLDNLGMDTEEPDSEPLLKTCKKGHAYDWNRRRCPFCVKDRNKEWRKENRAIVNRINRESYHRNKPADVEATDGE